jgi:hypothetical protein
MENHFNVHKVEATIYFTGDQRALERIKASYSESLPLACASVDGLSFFAQIKTIPESFGEKLPLVSKKIRNRLNL